MIRKQRKIIEIQFSCHLSYEWQITHLCDSQQTLLEQKNSENNISEEKLYIMQNKFFQVIQGNSKTSRSRFSFDCQVLKTITKR